MINKPHMFGIGEFFKKIQGSYAKEVLVRNIIKEAIFKHTGADIPISSIKFKADTAIISISSPVIRSSIYIKKTAIMDEVAGKPGAKIIRDIR